MSSAWYYVDGNADVGPVSHEELRKFLHSCRDGKNVPVWQRGFSEWKAAGDVNELFDLFDPRDTANPKLPLGDIIWFSYSSYFYNFPDVLRISWLWLAVAAALTGIANWLSFSWMAGVMADMKLRPGISIANPAAVMAPKPIETTVLESVAGLFLLLAGLSIAVAWHRHIILDERPGFSGSNIATKSFWRYVRVGFAVILPWLVVALLVFLFMFFPFAPVTTGGAPRFTILMPVVLFPLSLAALAVVLRLSLLFPARAVGDLDLTFKETWSCTRGNTWRLIWGMAACTVLPMLSAQIALVRLLSPGIVGFDAFFGRMAVIGTILAVYYLLILPIGVGFLSRSYRHFFMRVYAK
jgi:GYF domain 2